MSIFKELQNTLIMLTTKHAIKQLIADLIGKDSHRGITLTYAWLANQFGHFSLGALPTIFLVELSKHCEGSVYSICNIFSTSHPKFWAIRVSLFWFFFEIYNFLKPLLTRDKGKDIKKKHPFKPEWVNISYDTIIDILFFTLGSFSINLWLSGFSTKELIIPTILAVILIFPSVDWYFTKMYQQYAKYPFQFRLAQWNKQILDDHRKKILEFQNLDTTGNHLLLFGAKLSGKTSLGIGICNELSIKKKICYYTTGTKIYSMFLENQYNAVNPSHPWSWKEADFLIIDDINPGYPFDQEIVSAKDFIHYLDCFDNIPLKPNRDLIRNKNIIWILGNCGKDSNPREWVMMLINQLGVPENKLHSICL